MIAADGDQVERLLKSLFGADRDCRREDLLIAGHGTLDGERIAVIGTVERAPMGARLALALARCVLEVIREAPGRPILLIVNNSGQLFSRWDELMGNNGYVAHLGKCLDQARRRGHRVIGVVVELAVSAGFMATGMATDRCYALADAELRLMPAAAISRVTNIPEERLAELFRTNPVLGPGVENFVRIGALQGVLAEDAARQIAAALRAAAPPDDARRRQGSERGGRRHAAEVADLVRAGREA